MMTKPSPDLSRRIRERAFTLWQQEGCPDNRAARHWQLAEAAEQAVSDHVVDVEEEDSFPASDPPSRSPVVGLR